MSFFEVLESLAGKEVKFSHEAEFSPGSVNLGVICCLRKSKTKSGSEKEDDMMLIVRYPYMTCEHYVYIDGKNWDSQSVFSIKGIMTSFGLDKFTISFSVGNHEIKLLRKEVEIVPYQTDFVKLRTEEDL